METDEVKGTTRKVASLWVESSSCYRALIRVATFSEMFCSFTSKKRDALTRAALSSHSTAEAVSALRHSSNHFDD